MYQTLFPLLKLHGSQALAVSTLQPSCQQFVLNNGYIAYFTQKHSNHIFVLGDPVCSKQDTQSILEAFLNTFPNATFTQISNHTASLLRSFGHRINTFGEEHVLDPTTAALTWRSHKSLRRESNKALKQGITTRLVSFQTLLKHDYTTLSNTWLKTRKNKRRQQFLTRPLPLQEEPDTLYFGAYYKDILVGFSILSPVYQHNTVTGYYADITRYLPQHSLSLYLLHFHIIKYLKKLNVTHLSLGVSCYDIDPSHQFYSHPIIKYMLKGVMKWGNWLYAFKQLHRFKLRFHGIKRPLYIASTSRLPILELLQIFLITTRRQKK